MKLLRAIQLGSRCGMKTIDDCLYNVYLHSMNLFPYAEIDSEEKELSDEFLEAEKKIPGLRNMGITEALDKLNVKYEICPSCGDIAFDDADMHFINTMSACYECSHKAGDC